jgi:hypothetical protein
MSEKKSHPEVHVAVALIKRGSNILLAYNSDWGSYTLPMTKVRDWEDPDRKYLTQKEPWPDAAARAAGEWIAETFHLDAEPILAPIEVQQSDRDQKWKEYHFQVFEIEVEEDTKLLPDIRIEWLMADDIVDPNRRPISDTAKLLVGQLQEAGRL